MTSMTCKVFKISNLAKRLKLLENKLPYCSVANTLEKDDAVPRFRTAETDPLKHNELHLAKFYTMPLEEKNRLFVSGGISKSHDIQMQVFQEYALMIRSPAIEIISYLQRYNFSGPALRIVVYGKNGVGKTCTLMHLVHYGHRANNLLLHIPWVSNWTKRPKEMVDSETRPGRIDLPVEAVSWLQHFKTQNFRLLKELDLRTSKTYTWSQREVTEEGQPLIDVLEHGLERGVHASDCIAVLLKEIKQQSNSGKYRTMVVIDGVNAFYDKTNLRRPNKVLAPAKTLTMVNAFEKMLKPDWTNAAVITSVDVIIRSRDFSQPIPYTPRALLGKDGFEVLDPFIPVEVKNYTDKEMESILDYYTDRMWLQHEEARAEKGRAELKFLSGHNPYSLRKLCDPL